jgi:tRNA A-37 threonylcarbamoyl transferase component Bud32
MHAVTNGHLVVGRYRLLEPIGRGAMGIVWRGRDELLDREVAIKEVRAAGLTTPAETEVIYQRTLREAKAAARLNHPSLVTVFDVVEQDGSPWIVMELVLARSLDRLIVEDGPLPPWHAARVGADLLSALECAHAAGVLHRDVKPANVLLGADDRTVLTDFGIATFDDDPGLTQPAMVFGTPGFTSPERVRGEPATPASDLWSLGATLYTAVEGRGPFARLGGCEAISAGVLTEDAPRAPSAGPLGPVIDALLRADPRDRPEAATAARMLADAVAGAGAGPPRLAGGPVPSALPASPAFAAGPEFPDLAFSPDLPGPAQLAEFDALQAPEDLPAAGVGRALRPHRHRRSHPPTFTVVAVAVAAAAAVVGWSVYSHAGGAPAATAGTTQAAHGSTGTAGSTAGRPPAPAGYRWFEVTAAGTVAGFEIAAPASWHMTSHGLATYLMPPGGDSYIEVSRARFTRSDPEQEASARQSQAVGHGRYPGYQLIAIRPGTFLDAPAATWRFSWRQDRGRRVGVLELLTNITTRGGTQPYVLSVSAPAVAFPRAAATFRQALRTFRPVG